MSVLCTLCNVRRSPSTCLMTENFLVHKIFISFALLTNFHLPTVLLLEKFYFRPMWIKNSQHRECKGQFQFKKNHLFPTLSEKFTFNHLFISTMSSIISPNHPLNDNKMLVQKMTRCPSLRPKLPNRE